MQDLRSKTYNEIKEIAQQLGLPEFKGKEIFRFIHVLLKDDIDSFTTLNKEERALLKKEFNISKIVLSQVNKSRKVQKIAFELEDKSIIETVLMEYEKGRKTLCISSQVGCPVGCLFCATGQMGFKRNLTMGEILAQVYYFSQAGKISNIVFMGMGDPFFNYNNVLKAARVLNSPLGQNIAARKIVISTIGLVSGINKFTKEPAQFRLAWSLAAPFDQLRKKLVPFNRLDSIEQVIESLREYQKTNGRRVTIEYVVLGGVNDDLKAIEGLIKIAKQLDCHVNLIEYNEASMDFVSSSRINHMFGELQKARVTVTIRKSLGQDISAACGQLSSQLL